MTKHGSNSEIGSLYDQWAGEEDERREQSDRLKEFFADAKDQGFNPKAMRAAFKEQYRLENETFGERDKREAADAVVDEYLASLARVRARENIEEFDPETGEITEPAALPASKPNAADAPIVGAGGSADPLGTAATISPPADSPVASAPALGGSDVTAQTGESGQALPDPIRNGLASPALISGRSRAAITKDAPLSSATSVGGTAEHEAHELSSHADAVGPTPAASAAPGKRKWNYADPPHRDCLDPDQCGGFSNLALCQRCKDAAANDREVSAA